MKFYIIPKINEIEKWNKLSKDFGLGYEYNEFYNPNLLDDFDKLETIISSYEKLKRVGDTLHGVFLDINFASSDSKIKNISFERARSSLKIAVRLKCKAVIFHTNYQTWIKGEEYKNTWIKESVIAYKKLLREFPSIDIYLENMFDDDPYLLARLVSELKDEKRFGVCLDVAHAHISNTPINIWFESLLPYIKHIHLNDNDRTNDSHLALAEGTIDYMYVLNIAKKLDVSVLLEMNNYDDVIKSLKIVREVKV